MGRNNQRRKMIPEQRNFKLYKHKKQWMTACATFLLTFGATAVMNVSASANTDNTSNGGSTPKIAEVVSGFSEYSQEKSNKNRLLQLHQLVNPRLIKRQPQRASKRKLQRPNQLKR